VIVSSEHDKKDVKKAEQAKTRLQAELAHRYQSGQAVGRKKKPGAGSLTEDLAPQEAEVDVEQEHEAEQAQEQEAQEVIAAEPKPSLFNLPRKEPIRPSLLGGGIEVDAPAPAAAPASSSGKPSGTGGTATPAPGRSSTTRRR
jgi:hypothetical protein